MAQWTGTWRATWTVSMMVDRTEEMTSNRSCEAHTTIGPATICSIITRSTKWAIRVWPMAWRSGSAAAMLTATTEDGVSETTTTAVTTTSR